MQSPTPKANTATPDSGHASTPSPSNLHSGTPSSHHSSTTSPIPLGNWQAATPALQTSTPLTIPPSSPTVTNWPATQTPTSNTSATPPALPPRPLNLSVPSLESREVNLSSSLSRVPPPPPSQQTQLTPQSITNGNGSNVAKAFGRKYVVLCCLCGMLCLLLGSAYLTIYLVLLNNTTSMHYFETMPTYVPCVPLFISGMMIIAFSNKRYRNNILIKTCGCLCLVCAVLCVVVTVTTTVIHMNRLQTLRECVFQSSSKSCTCFAGLLDPFSHEGGIHYIFGGVSTCSAIHGVLYSCLRGLFGISVIGILLCIFSCMLVYQLLSHEKKKEYWSRLESRCQMMHQQSGNSVRPISFSTSSNNILNLSQAVPIYTAGEERFLSPYEERPNNLGRAPTSTNLHASSSFNSIRNWLRRGRSNAVVPLNSNPSGTSNYPPHWRHSNPPNLYSSSSTTSESNYGFHSNRGSVLPSASCHQYLSVVSGSSEGGQVVPHYIWDPPPPYSQPTENVPTNATGSANPTTPSQGVQMSNSGLNATPTSLNNNASQGQANSQIGGLQHRPLQRTTKSGLLPTTSSNQDGKINKNYCYSLPSRRSKQNKKAFNKSVTNIDQSFLNEEELLMLEVRQKLNALLMYKYQHSKASRELTEVRQALHKLQMSSLKEKHYLTKSTNFKPPKLVRPNPVKTLVGLHNGGGRNRNSTSSGTSSIENKYETIGKSLSPYKIDKSQVKTETIPESVSHKDLRTLSPTLSSSASSSHYAHISPLKGTGLPTPAAFSSYFKEISNTPSNISSVAEQKLSNARSDPYLGANAATQSQNSSGARNRKIMSIPNTPEKKVYPVYLRPEQNIPDIFANTRFQPIQGSETETSESLNDLDCTDHASKSSSTNLASSKSADNISLQKSISRNDIVVTMRSAQV